MPTAPITWPSASPAPLIVPVASIALPPSSLV
jgi:hypothetical protein